jgi:hypothetical protein
VACGCKQTEEIPSGSSESSSVVPTPDQSSIPDYQPSSIPSATPTIVPSQPPVTVGPQQPVTDSSFVCHICGEGSLVVNEASAVFGRTCGDVFQEGLEGKISLNECQVFQVSSISLVSILQVL